jgi:hypothetical protein
MIREYAEAREYLDEVTVQVERLVRRYHRMRIGTNEPAALRALAELDLEADRADELIRARCAASRALGIDLPLDRLRRAFALSPTEARLVEVLVAFELAAPVREAAAPYLDKDGMTTIEVVEALVYRSARTRGASSEELVTDGRLFRFHIAELGGSQMPWLARPIKIAPRVVELALGRLRLDPEVGRVATLVLAPTSGAHLLQDRR